MEYERTAEEMEREAAEMQHASDSLEEDIRETRSDWKRKEADAGVPGADPPGSDLSHDDPVDETEGRG